MQKQLRDTLKRKLQDGGLEAEVMETLLKSFDLSWENAHPEPSTEVCNWHPHVRYLSLPGSYSQAEREVVEAFGLLEAHPTPPEE